MSPIERREFCHEWRVAQPQENTSAAQAQRIAEHYELPPLFEYTRTMKLPEKNDYYHECLDAISKDASLKEHLEALQAIIQERELSLLQEEASNKLPLERPQFYQEWLDTFFPEHKAMLY